MGFITEAGSGEETSSTTTTTQQPSTTEATTTETTTTSSTTTTGSPSTTTTTTQKPTTITTKKPTTTTTKKPTTTDEPSSTSTTTKTTSTTTTEAPTTTTTKIKTTAIMDTTSTTEAETITQKATTIEEPTTTETSTTTKVTTTTKAATTTTTESPTTTKKTTSESTTTTQAATTTTPMVTTSTTENPSTTRASTTAEPTTLPETTSTTTTSTTTTTQIPSTTSTTTNKPTTTSTTTNKPTTTDSTTTDAPKTTTENLSTTTTEQTTTKQLTTTSSPETTTTTITDTPSTLPDTTTTSTTVAPTTTTTDAPTTTEKITTSTTTETPTTTTISTTTTTFPTTTTTLETTSTTTLEPTTTTVQTTTYSAEPTGPFYNETSDYHYPNMVRNSTTSDGVAITNGPLGFGWAVNLDSNRENDTHCLKMNIVEKSERDEKCFRNPEECSEGISISIWLKITFFREDGERRFIYSSGAGEGGYPGVALYFRGIFLNLLVSTGNELWNLTVPGPVKNNSWNEIGMRWSKDSGLEMFVNGEPVGHMIYPEEVSPVIDREESMDFTVGCLKSKDGELKGYAYGEYDELTIWMKVLDNNHTDYFLGGHDPNTTCDVELHPLHCETNLQKVLEIMESMEVESTEALLNALGHLKDLSDVEEDSPGSEDDLSEKKRSEELKNLITIVDKMINMTWNKPNDLSVEDLQDLMVIQDFASNLLDEKYIESWSQNDDFRTSVDLMNRVRDYQMQKLKQTKSDDEKIELTRNASNIFSELRQSTLYDLLSDDAPISFPSQDEKREVSEEKTLIVTNDLYGYLNKEETVSLLMSSYKGLDRISPLRNTNTGTSYVFLDSEVVSLNCNPNASAPSLEKDPLIITLKHKRKVKATGRKLLADSDLREHGEIRKRECMRWDSTLEIEGRRGGWTSDGCSIAKSDVEETKCKCTQTGTFAIMSKLKQPFEIPREPEWVKLTKWVCYGLSFAMLIFYITVILFKRSLHDQFHVIRLNLAVAALGGLVSFFLSPFFYEEEDNCRILSILIHFFYTATGAWLAAESSALFSGLVNGSFGGMITFHLLIGWVIPGGMIGGCFMVVRNYGYDYRCLVGPTAGMRWLLVSPVLISAALALGFAILTCANYGTPAVKKTAIVNELSSATRANLIVILLYLSTWLCGVFALVDLGFDSDEIPTFNPIFQILNACLGVFVVALIGFGSKHFRYCLCHSTKSRTNTKAINLDPFDVHDKAKINSRKKIYLS